VRFKFNGTANLLSAHADVDGVLPGLSARTRARDLRRDTDGKPVRERIRGDLIAHSADANLDAARSKLHGPAVHPARYKSFRDR